MTQEKKDKPNRIDKVLNILFLWMLPRFVTPNHLTIARFVSIPFVAYFLWKKEYGIALPLFAVSAFTDALDGALARTRSQITDWGRLFDPIADKVLIALSAIVLISNEISFVLGMLIILIDLIILFTVAYQYNAHRKIFNPHWTGKAKMLLQSLGVGTFLLYMVLPIMLISWVAIGFLYLAVIFGLISFLIYRSA